MGTVQIDGEILTPQLALEVARKMAVVELCPRALMRVKRSRAVVEKLLESGSPVYGLNTGFGSLRDVHIGASQAKELQSNLIRSHCCGVGEPAPHDVVRAMMLLRANTLAKGHSGVRPVVIETIVQMLNRHIYPFVPIKGSVGASGDLAPLSHLALVMIGDEQAEVLVPFETPWGEEIWRRVPALPELKRAGIEPLELEAKEGLALNNGTQFMTAVGVLAMLDAEYLTTLAIHACALSLEALQGVPKAYDNRIHRVRNQPGQKRVAGMLRRLLKGSEILSSPVNLAILNGACDELEKATSLMLEPDKESFPESRADRALLRDAAERAQKILETLKEKRVSVLRPIVESEPYRQPESAQDATEERIRLAAAEQFADAIQALRKLYDEVFTRTSKNGREEICDHLQTARERLETTVPKSLPVQDDYSLRCAPQVIGAALDTLRYSKSIIENELNAATDNPLIFPPDLAGVASDDLEEYRKVLSLLDCKRVVLSGGNFHGEPIALVMDHSCLALAAIANIAERRIFHLTTGRLSNGLPRFLTPHAGLQSGLMIAQVTAASLVSENKVLCHPASADSIPTIEDAEDHVSMGAFAARKFAEVVQNVTKVVAIELICAAQGVRFRRPVRLSPANQVLLAEVDRLCAELDHDRPFCPDIERVAKAISDRRFTILDFEAAGDEQDPSEQRWPQTEH